MIVFVLRHADRNAEADALSAVGAKRARLLANMLAESGVSKAFCSDALRTHQTLAPLKQTLGGRLSITEFSAAGQSGPDGHVEAVVAAIQALPSDTIAVAVSHSDTVGPIVEGLGGGGTDAIGDTEFDRLLVLFIPPDGRKTLLQLRY
ncbi:histidine phosphatase family protein [Mesorhizobium waimense]|uniref:Histidine phosphatase family protein n=1 Tax=Mesorhizobium waimense TaxID=1300307 RepID=A0A3A5JVU3_9HYPH|nr:histidine phosphatase family protein [Mesorhizobium waimense]RJT24191.1 histidine phosphatase family protein [Mesorhizobium waimense]